MKKTIRIFISRPPIDILANSMMVFYGPVDHVYYTPLGRLSCLRSLFRQLGYCNTNMEGAHHPMAQTVEQPAG